jgi:hypothetical protein
MPLENFNLSNLSLAELAEARYVEAAELSLSKQRLMAVDDEIASRLAADADAAYLAAEKDTGKVTLGVEIPGYTAEASRTKKVIWDQKRMRAIAGSLAWDAAQHWLTFEIEMTEAKFKALPPGDLRTQIEEARTVVPGGTKVSLVKRIA